MAIKNHPATYFLHVYRGYRDSYFCCKITGYSNDNFLILLHLHGQSSKF